MSPHLTPKQKRFVPITTETAMLACIVVQTIVQLAEFYLVYG